MALKMLYLCRAAGLLKMNSADTLNWGIARWMADSYSSKSHDLYQFSVSAKKSLRREREKSLKKFILAKSRLSETS